MAWSACAGFSRLLVAIIYQAMKIFMSTELWFVSYNLCSYSRGMTKCRPVSEPNITSIHKMKTVVNMSCEESLSSLSTEKESA